MRSHEDHKPGERVRPSSSMQKKIPTKNTHVKTKLVKQSESQSTIIVVFTPHGTLLRDKLNKTEEGDGVPKSGMTGARGSLSARYGVVCL